MVYYFSDNEASPTGKERNDDDDGHKEDLKLIDPLELIVISLCDSKLCH